MENGHGWKSKKNPKTIPFFFASPRLYGDVRIPMAMRFSCLGAALSGWSTMEPWQNHNCWTFWCVLMRPRVGQVNLVLASCKENVLIRRDVAIRSLGVESAINCGLAREVIWELCGIALLEAWWQIWLAETSWSSPCQTWSRQAPFHEETWRTRAARNQSFESWWDERDSELQRGIYLRCSQNKILGRLRKETHCCLCLKNLVVTCVLLLEHFCSGWFSSFVILYRLRFTPTTLDPMKVVCEMTMYHVSPAMWTCLRQNMAPLFWISFQTLWFLPSKLTFRKVPIFCTFLQPYSGLSIFRWWYEGTHGLKFFEPLEKTGLASQVRDLASGKRIRDWCPFDVQTLKIHSTILASAPCINMHQSLPVFRKHPR